MATEAQELNEANKLVAEEYNSKADASDVDSSEEMAARAASNAIDKVAGNTNHDGDVSVVEDTPADVKAKDAATAEAKVTADKETADAARLKAFEGKTPVELQEAQEEAVRVALAAQVAKEVPKATDEAPVDADWIKSDSKEFNAALSLMKSEGMTPADATKIFDTAINSGDPTQVDREALVEKLGEDKAELVLAGFSTWSQQAGADTLARAKNINDQVGGAKNFAEMITWARGKAEGDTEFSDKVNTLTEMMNGTELQGTLAIKEFASMYNADAGNTTLDMGNTVQSISTGQVAQVAAVVSTPVSAQVYAEGIENAQRDFKGAALVSKMNELSQSRAAGRRLGY